MALALVRNYDAFRAPRHFRAARYVEEARQGDWARRDATTATSRASGRWTIFSAGGRTAGICCLWRACGSRICSTTISGRTEQCIIPYATQEGEISFCAYNTGMGWRNIIEKMHMTATLTKWYEEHGRHEIFAGGKSVKLSSTEHHLVLKDEIVTNEAQHDLEQLGIAKNAREEKLRARAERDAENSAHGQALSRVRVERAASSESGADWDAGCNAAYRRAGSRERRLDRRSHQAPRRAPVDSASAEDSETAATFSDPGSSSPLYRPWDPSRFAFARESAPGGEYRGPEPA